MRVPLTFVSILAFAGCASFQTEGYSIEPGIPASPAAWEAGEVAPIPPTGDWVASFNDATLSGLVEEAQENNPTLAASLASVEASRAAAAAEFGASRPQFNAGADVSQNNSVVDVNDNAFRDSSQSYGLSLTASWEPDLWGRIRSGIAASEATLAASEADYQAARLSLAGNTAISWFQLKEAIRQEELAQETLEARQRTLTLTERRFRNGLSGALDVRLSRSAVESERASLTFRKRATAEARRAIEVLLGRYPANEIAANGVFLELPTLSGAGDPTNLLARRPDIQAAEARIASAGFRVDEARLALRPSLNLSARLFSNNEDFADILDPSFIASQLAASLTAPLFTGGRLEANIDATKAQAEIASAQYVSAVLTAWQEVENAIAADALLAEQLESQLRALEEARLAETLAERQYQSGLSTIFNLIDAQTRRINAESQVISAQSARAINRVQFHLALGGTLPTGPEAQDLSG